MSLIAFWHLVLNLKRFYFFNLFLGKNSFEHPCLRYLNSKNIFLKEVSRLFSQKPVQLIIFAMYWCLARYLSVARFRYWLEWGTQYNIHIMHTLIMASLLKWYCRCGWKMRHLIRWFISKVDWLHRLGKRTMNHRRVFNAMAHDYVDYRFFCFKVSE